MLSALSNNGGPFDEGNLHVVAQQLFRATRYLHDRDLLHADLKLDNILLHDASVAGLRLIDFGLAVNVKTEADQLAKPRGSLNYMPPEMFFPNATFGFPADIWSLGVILFTLATGSFPFGGATEAAVIEEITMAEEARNARFMTLPQFAGLSEPLKELIGSLLRYDPAERITAHAALLHPWMAFRRQASLREAAKFVDTEDLRRMAAYGQTKVLKKLTLMYIGCHLHPSMLAALQEQFTGADQDASGTISPHEFHVQFCKSVGHDVPLECTNMLFEIIDTNENGVIDFSEFKACLLRSQISLNEELLRKAFNFFDKDKSGMLTK